MQLFLSFASFFINSLFDKVLVQTLLTLFVTYISHFKMFFWEKSALNFCIQFRKFAASRFWIFIKLNWQLLTFLWSYSFYRRNVPVRIIFFLILQEERKHKMFVAIKQIESVNPSLKCWRKFFIPFVLGRIGIEKRKKDGTMKPCCNWEYVCHFLFRIIFHWAMLEQL